MRDNQLTTEIHQYACSKQTATSTDKYDMFMNNLKTQNSSKNNQKIAQTHQRNKTTHQTFSSAIYPISDTAKKKGH